MTIFEEKMKDNEIFCPSCGHNTMLLIDESEAYEHSFKKTYYFECSICNVQFGIFDDYQEEVEQEILSHFKE